MCWLIYIICEQRMLRSPGAFEQSDQDLLLLQQLLTLLVEFHDVAFDDVLGQLPRAKMCRSEL